MIEIKQLSNTSIEAIYHSFNRAFEDYVEPVQMTLSQFQHMIERRGYNAEISFGAFDGGELVGFTLNGQGSWQGIETAYDTGTGIIKRYRKQGLATRILEESLELLRKKGIRQYLLEVIKTNTKALDLYRKAGFNVTREFDYFVESYTELDLPDPVLPISYEYRENIRIDWDRFRQFWAFEPSWQNSIESINRKPDAFKTIGIQFNKQIIGYGIIEPESGDIPQLCIQPEYRKRKLASALFAKLTTHSKSDKIKMINTQSSYLPQQDFMSSLGFSTGIGQLEMVRKL